MWSRQQTANSAPRANTGQADPRLREGQQMTRGRETPAPWGRRGPGRCHAGRRGERSNEQARCAPPARAGKRPQAGVPSAAGGVDTVRGRSSCPWTHPGCGGCGRRPRLRLLRSRLKASQTREKAGPSPPQRCGGGAGPSGKNCENAHAHTHAHTRARTRSWDFSVECTLHLHGLARNNPIRLTRPPGNTGNSLAVNDKTGTKLRVWGSSTG